MGRVVMTEQAKAKVQELAKNPSGRISLRNFARVSSAYTGVSSKIPTLNIFRKNYTKKMVRKIRAIDDMYMFNDRNNRFIFTVEEGKDHNPTAILLDVIDKEEARNELNDLHKRKVK